MKFGPANADGNANNSNDTALDPNINPVTKTIWATREPLAQLEAGK